MFLVITTVQHSHSPKKDFQLNTLINNKIKLRTHYRFYKKERGLSNTQQTPALSLSSFAIYTKALRTNKNKGATPEGDTWYVK
jgi:hypothetical protein